MINSCYDMLENYAVIKYLDNVYGGKERKAVTNKVTTKVYKSRLILHVCKSQPCVYEDICGKHVYYHNCCYIYNYSLCPIEDVYIEIIFPSYLKYIEDSLQVESCEARYDECSEKIFVKRIEAMEKIWIYFDYYFVDEKYSNCSKMFKVKMKYNIKMRNKTYCFYKYAIWKKE